MLFPTCEHHHCYTDEMFDAYELWHPDMEERHAAADYALDGTARSYGTNGDDRRTGQGGDWSPSRSHRWWLIDHRAGLA